MLKKIMKLFKNGEKGFTLIELLVVIAILGVLAAVAVPNVMGFMTRGNASAIAANTAALQTAVDAYAANNNGAYPALNAATLVPDYIRAWPTLGNYTMSANGTVAGVP